MPLVRDYRSGHSLQGAFRYHTEQLRSMYAVTYVPAAEHSQRWKFGTFGGSQDQLYYGKQERISRSPVEGNIIRHQGNRFESLQIELVRCIRGQIRGGACGRYIGSTLRNMTRCRGSTKYIRRLSGLRIRGPAQRAGPRILSSMHRQRARWR